METPGNDSSSPHSGGAVGAKRKKTMAAQPVESLPEIEHILTQHMDMDDGDNTDGSGKCRMIMRIGTMDSLQPGEYRSCPIAMEDFDKVQVEDFVSPCSSFVKGVPEYCVGRLPCGHHFHPVALLCHMVMNGMNCPVCRQGSKKLVSRDSIPPHLRRDILRNVRKNYMLEMEQLMRSDRDVARQMQLDEADRAAAAAAAMTATTASGPAEVVVSRGLGLPPARLFASFLGPGRASFHPSPHPPPSRPPASATAGPAASLIIAVEQSMREFERMQHQQQQQQQARESVVDEEITRSIVSAWGTLMSMDPSSSHAANANGSRRSVWGGSGGQGLMRRSATTTTTIPSPATHAHAATSFPNRFFNHHSDGTVAHGRRHPDAHREDESFDEEMEGEYDGHDVMEPPSSVATTHGSSDDGTRYERMPHSTRPINVGEVLSDGRLESVMLIVYLYRRDVQSWGGEAAEEDEEGEEEEEEEEMGRRQHHHAGAAHVVSWHIKGLEYELSRVDHGGGGGAAAFAMDDAQVLHLSQGMREVNASNLRFTVYTTLRGASSEVVELLNTGMIATSMFEDDRDPAVAVAEPSSSRVVLDFDVDGKLILTFSSSSSPAGGGRAAAAGGTATATTSGGSMFGRLQSLKLVAA